MTRDEQIEKEAHRVSYNSDEYGSFIQGAEWADRTMLERMLKYLEVEHPTFYESFGEEIRKAMEE